jgi:hypothetical protein
MCSVHSTNLTYSNAYLRYDMSGVSDEMIIASPHGKTLNIERHSGRGDSSILACSYPIRRGYCASKSRHKLCSAFTAAHLHKDGGYFGLRGAQQKPQFIGDIFRPSFAMGVRIETRLWDPMSLVPRISPFRLRPVWFVKFVNVVRIAE